jgi:CRP/FNR family transcriptional regulator, cyclic AMP receptor protein
VPATVPRRDEPLPLAMTVRAGTTLVRQGEPCSLAWIVRAGALWESLVLADGRELALDVLGPGSLVGEPDGATAAATVQTLRVCRLTPVDPEGFAALFADRARRASRLAAELAWSDVPSRLRARLDDLATRFGMPDPGGTAIELRLTQDRLARLCGTTRETVNRALRLLVANGELRHAGVGRFVVLDRSSGIARPGDVVALTPSPGSFGWPDGRAGLSAEHRR